MADIARQKEYQVQLHLPHNVRLEMLMFSHQEHRWIFKHLRRQYDTNQEKLLLVQNTRLVVDYHDGVIGSELVLHIDLVLPQKRGRLFVYGADVSPGSLVNLTLAYQLTGADKDAQYRLVRVENGLEVFELAKLEPALIKQVEVPFPLLDTISFEGGIYRVPFLANDGSEHHFTFPHSICR